MGKKGNIEQNNKDNSLYVWAVMVIPIIVVIGFARTYYLKGFFGTPALPGLVVHLHGIVMTCWVILFATQVLIAKKSIKLHKRLGFFGAGLATLMLLIGIATSIAATARENSVEALKFLVVPLGDILVFISLFAIAFYYRKIVECHKRLMLLTTVSLLSPAIARIPLSFIETGGAVVFFGLTDICVCVCVIFDTIRHKKLHIGFVCAALLIVLSQPLRLMLAETEIWLRLATWLVRF